MRSFPYIKGSTGATRSRYPFTAGHCKLGGVDCGAPLFAGTPVFGYEAGELAQVEGGSVSGTTVAGVGVCYHSTTLGHEVPRRIGQRKQAITHLLWGEIRGSGADNGRRVSADPVPGTEVMEDIEIAKRRGKHLALAKAGAVVTAPRG